jgi:hypothetical protein
MTDDKKAKKPTNNMAELFPIGGLLGKIIANLTGFLGKKR